MSTHLMYVRDSKYRPVGCVAYRLANEAESVTIELSLSICHREDVFDKQLAREIAAGRLECARTSSEKFEFVFKNVGKQFRTRELLAVCLHDIYSDMENVEVAGRTRQILRHTTKRLLKSLSNEPFATSLKKLKARVSQIR